MYLIKEEEKTIYAVTVVEGDVVIDEFYYQTYDVWSGMTFVEYHAEDKTSRFQRLVKDGEIDKDEYMFFTPEEAMEYAKQVVSEQIVSKKALLDKLENTSLKLETSPYEYFKEIIKDSEYVIMCASCGELITGTIYLTDDDRPLCEDCWKELLEEE